MKTKGIGAVLGVLLAVSPAFAAGLLDGKTFTGTVGNASSDKGQADDFVFRDGKFSSKLCDQFGYKEGDYWVFPKDNATTFTAKTASDAGGKKSWSGSVKGNSLEGTVTTVENGKTEQGWFKGQLKTA